METTPLIPRAQARQGIDAAIDWYLQEAGPTVAGDFIDALEAAFVHLGRHAATGSPRYAHELDLPGLRAWPLTRYPYLVFYVERGDHVDVWRVLHMQRDIPAWMQTPEET